MLAGCNNSEQATVQTESVVESNSTPKIKEEKNFTIPLSKTVKLEMIWIEPGTFMMGSPSSELGRFDNETQHEVTLTKGYWLGKYEVTQSQYETVIGRNPSKFKGSDMPVEMVNWNDAKEFCAKLTEIEKKEGRLPEGYEYTLPTEAQWEYACRAGTTTAFNNGKNIPTKEQEIEKSCSNLDEVGWYFFNGKKTHSVGQKQPNAWGLYDMHGNVWEWCLDYCDSNLNDGVVTDTYRDGISDPLCKIGSECVRRGGCWVLFAQGCRSAIRNSDASIYRGNYIGFRVALVPVQ